MALRHIFKARTEGKQVIQLDIDNAFGNVSHKRLLGMLHKRGLSGNAVSYIQKFLTVRRPVEFPDYGPFKCGIAQGCPLSMLLFCVVMDDVIAKLQEKYGEENVVVYADDIVVIVPMETPPEEVVHFASDAAKSDGLEVNHEKCNSTKTKDLLFLGTPIPRQDATSQSVADFLL